MTPSTPFKLKLSRAYDQSAACPCCPNDDPSESHVHVSDGKEANREDYHHMGDALIGEVYPPGDAELRTEAPGSSKAASGPGSRCDGETSDIRRIDQEDEWDSEDEVSRTNWDEHFENPEEEIEQNLVTEEQRKWAMHAVHVLEDNHCLRPKYRSGITYKDLGSWSNIDIFDRRERAEQPERGRRMG